MRKLGFLLGVLLGAVTDPPVADWTGIIVNGVTTGGLALILLVLHRESIRLFRDELREERASNKIELAAERTGNAEHLKEFMALKIRQHAELTGSLANQDKVLARILDAMIRQWPDNRGSK